MVITEPTDAIPPNSTMPSVGTVPTGNMMTSSNENISRTSTGPLWEESTDQRWFPSQTPVTRSFDVFFAPEQTVEQINETPVIWDTIALIIWRHCDEVINVS